MLEDLKQFYDIILIDTCNEEKHENIIKIIIELSDLNLCIIEGNIIYMRKTVKILKKYNNENKKIKLIYNKKNKYTIKTIILKLIFAKYKLIGTLNYNNKFNKIINKNVNRFYINKDIRNEFYKIIKKI